MIIIGHHTCKRDGGEKYVLENAPFCSIYDSYANHKPFLGTGHYFWDDNIETAKWWGKLHYKDDYYVIEIALNLTSEYFFDLVGNRQHIKTFIALEKNFRQKGYETKNWTIAAFIEFLKKFQLKDPMIFPYKAIRAIDYSAYQAYKEQYKYFFVQPGKDNEHTFLNPRLIICLLEKNKCLISQPVIKHECTNQI